MTRSIQIKNLSENVTGIEWKEIIAGIRLLNTNLGIYDPITDPDVVIICKAIKNNFIGFTEAEILAAFELFVTLQLDLKPGKFKILSVTLVAEIFHSYLKYKKDILIKNQHHRELSAPDQKYIKMTSAKTFELYLIIPFEKVISGLVYRQAFLGGFEWVLYHKLNEYDVFPAEDKFQLYEELKEFKPEAKEGAIIHECQRLTARRWIQNHLDNKSDIRKIVSEILEPK